MMFFIFFGCAQPQSTLPVYNEQFTLEEQKIQSQLFAESWLNAYLDLSEIGYRILFGSADLCLEEDQIYDIGIDVATKFNGLNTPNFVEHDYIGYVVAVFQGLSSRTVKDSFDALAR